MTRNGRIHFSSVMVSDQSFALNSIRYKFTC
jgi:hypothetical protein